MWWHQWVRCGWWMVPAGLLMLVSLAVWTADTGHDQRAEMSELRKAQAVQEVQPGDAREHIRALEADLDRIAPHTLATDRSLR